MGTHIMCTADTLQRVPSWKEAALRKRARPSTASPRDRSIVETAPALKSRYSPLKDDFLAQHRSDHSRLRRGSAPDISSASPTSKQVRTRGVASAPRLRRRTLPEIVGAGKVAQLPSVAAGSAKSLAASVQIPRKHYRLIKAIFDDHDSDHDGWITQEEFVAAVSRADKKKAEDERLRIKSRFHDEGVGDSVGAMAEEHYLRGAHSQRQHAAAMFQAVTSKKAPQDAHHISMLDFLCFYHPHLPRAAVKRAHEKYTKKPAPPPKKRTLSDVEGAKEEVQRIFAGLDSNRDGLVRMRSLEPLMLRLGITEKDVEGWLEELPPVLQRAGGNLTEGGSICRKKSKLNLQDMEKLLEPVFLPPSPKKLTREQINKQLEFNKELVLDAMYGN